MALRHYAYSFDVDGFVKSASPLVESVDKGDLRPLFEMTAKTIRNGFQGSWLLEEAGSRLPGEDELVRFNSVGLPRSQPVEDYLKNVVAPPFDEIGYWLLIILSRHLQEFSGIGADYSVLEAALGNVGWSEIDREHLILGLPSCRLIRSDCTRLAQRNDSDPYWHWLVPSHAQSSGWLPYLEARKVLDLLAQTQPAIRNYDVCLFPNPWGLTGDDLSDSRADWNSHLQIAFDRAVTMLETAVNAENGVFMVMAY